MMRRFAVGYGVTNITLRQQCQSIFAAIHAVPQSETQSISAQSLNLIEERLGRAPRGLRSVAVVDEQGEPMVIRVASLVDDRPFPTLFWLIDPVLNLRIDREEAAGTIAELQTKIDTDESLRQSMAQDHRDHIQLRESFLAAEDRALLEARGQWPALAERGIGGISDFTRIRCLHTWYAAHLVVLNTVGRLLDDHWQGAGGQAP